MEQPEHRPLAAATSETGAGGLRAPIRASWQRCAAFGLDAGRKPDFGPLSPQRLREMREQNRLLTLNALPVMEHLYRQIVDTESMIVLTDARGLILHSIGDDAFLQRAEKVALKPGVVWSEQEKGTNAIGTAIATLEPTLVHGPEHYLTVNHFLTCSAVPINDPQGALVCVVHVTSHLRGDHRHTMALVQMSASVIENSLFRQAFPHDVAVHFHARGELIGTLFEGICVFREDGTLLAANKSALFQFGQDLARLRGRGFAELFGVPLPAVLNQLAVRMDRPVTLSLPTGVRVLARVHCGRARVTVHPRPLEGESPRPAVPRQAPVPAPDTLDGLDSGDPQVRAVIARVRRIVAHDIPILIQGETGTGKELLARAIHEASPRAKGPFVAVNCAAIPEGLIESELFGYEEGAFTGARRRGHVGKILQADGGTLFLDEIGDMPLPLQARLLRVLQERAVTPLGSTRAIGVNAAVICATHRRLRDAIAAGTFREDLYYRLNVFPINIPPLRERKQDIPFLVEHFIKKLAGETGSRVRTVSDEALRRLMDYHWPGNVRELENVIERSLLLATGERLEASDIRLEVNPRPPAAGQLPFLPEGMTLDQYEQALIREALRRTGGNKSRAARLLGLTRNALRYRLSQMGIEDPGG
ncbi:MAG: sigma-54-dependent Fis family transcriptional regulator [Burkholderiaceae bacterium]|nr:sigma-54-dependent Fis family transcriptional regulator [Burkholderiaceae bacterium]